MDDPPGNPEEVTRFGRGRVKLKAGEKKSILATLKFMKFNLRKNESYKLAYSKLSLENYVKWIVVVSK